MGGRAHDGAEGLVLHGGGGHEGPWDSSTAGIKAGEILTVLDLLYCDLLPSGNEGTSLLSPSTRMAARQLGWGSSRARAGQTRDSDSSAVAGTSAEFVARMNAKAQALGMADTHFMNPHGLHDPEPSSTTREVMILVMEAGYIRWRALKS